MLLCVPVFSIVEIFCLWQADYDSKQYLSIEIAGFLILNIAVFYLYNALQDYYLQKSEKEEFRIAMESYRNQMDVMQESWEKIRSLRHDLKHHIGELRYLTAHRDTVQVLAYLDEMERQMRSGEEYVSSGIPEIDGTLNYLLQHARKTLDEVNVKVVLSEELEIHEFALNVILGNLLDNAIRAASQSGRKYLDVSLREKQGVLYIKIENSYSGLLRREEKKLLSTKSDAELHGIGLGNVEKIVRERDGEMEISWDEEIFCVKVMLFVEKRKRREEE